MKYADLIKPSAIKLHSKGVHAETISIKGLSFNNEVPRVTWTEEEVQKMNIMENIQYTVVGKFSYGWPELEDLRVHIPKQCNIKGE